MSINQKINEHPFIVIGSFCILVISAALGIMKWTYDERINNIVAKYEAEIAILKKERELTNRNTELKSVNENTNPAVTRAVQTNEKPEPKYGEIFRKGEPYPIEFDKAKIGTPISVLQTIYPSGSLDSSSYSVRLPDGPFSSVSYFHNESGNDPRVEWVTFYFRDDKARDYVRSQALSAFGSERLISSVMGKVLKWRMKGVQVSIDNSWYSVEKPQ